MCHFFRSCFQTMTFALFIMASSQPFASADEPKAEEPVQVKLPEGYVSEAPLPEGFPAPGEVGKVVEKIYPQSRTYSSTGKAAFMQLFLYLQKNRYEMTAPVIMAYKHKPADAPLLDQVMSMPIDVERLHFVLEKPTLDEPKEAGEITVADVPAVRVLSVALQGKREAEEITKAEKQLRDELTMREDLTEAGEMRILGYNGPGTPAKKRYWEVQLPVKLKKE